MLPIRSLPTGVGASVELDFEVSSVFWFDHRQITTPHVVWS